MMSTETDRMKPWIHADALRCCLCILLFVGTTAVTGSSRCAEKPVLVHYMPWFVARPHSPTWGYHWTMNSQDPDGFDGSGQRQIAAHHHPQIGPYDSADPVVLEYHVLLMKLAGIDGVIVDWYGMDNVHDFAINEARTLVLLESVRKAGLKFCLCYEDSTLRAAIDTGFIPASAAIAHGQQTMLHAQRTYFNDPSYLRFTNGQPLLLNFGPQFLKTDSQWTAVFSVLDPTNRPAFFTQDHRLSVGAGAFNWPPMHLIERKGDVLPSQVLERYLDRFEDRARGWPAFISSAFPRFHDYYQQAGVGASFGHLGDDGGQVFRHTLARAMTNDSAMVQLVTWNDFGEGTIIEPTVEYGYRDLGVIQELRRQYLAPNFPHDTNDLHLATRLYTLRRRHATNPAFSAKLNHIFQNIVDDDLSLADVRLTDIESKPSVSPGEGSSYSMLQIPAGVQGASTTNRAPARQPVGSLRMATNGIGLGAYGSP